MTPDRTLRGSIPVAWEAGYALSLPRGRAPRGGFPVLIALHGFGFDGTTMRAVLRGLNGAPYARLFLDAPFPVVVREESPPREGRSWYMYTGDQPAFMRALEFGADFIDDSLKHVAREHPIDRRRAVLLGHSQGGYLAGYAALRAPKRYAGLVAVACRVKVEALTASLPKARGFPALIVHGRMDRATLLEPQLKAAAVLESHGVAVERLIHDGGHGLSRDLVPKIDAFVRRVAAAVKIS